MSDDHELNVWFLWCSAVAFKSQSFINTLVYVLSRYRTTTHVLLQMGTMYSTTWQLVLAISGYFHWTQNLLITILCLVFMRILQN